MKLSLNMVMLSDWHISSGAGRPGDVDRLVRRDEDGLPYVPGRTLVGIWRDACETVAFGLDDGDKRNEWKLWVDYLFGEQPNTNKAATKAPKQAALSVTSLHLPANLRDKLVIKENRELREALTFVKPSMSIDPLTGYARQDHLMFHEMVRSGCVLVGEAELELPEVKGAANVAKALLVAGAQLVERLGGDRRRGSGKCRLTVNKPDFDAVEVISNCEECPKPPEADSNDEAKTRQVPLASTESGTTPAETSVQDNTTQEADSKSSWQVLDLVITAKSPLVIAGPTLGNVVTCLDYIPGTLLLPFVTRALGNHAIEAVKRGELVITNATIEIDKKQSLPIPQAFFEEKMGDNKKVINRFFAGPEDKQIKGIRHGYMTAYTATNFYSGNVSHGLVTHNIIDDKEQRPNHSVGGVYTYTSIASGSVLRAQLRIKDKDIDLSSFKAALSSDYRVGYAKKDEYGQVSITTADLVTIEIEVETTEQAELAVKNQSSLLSEVETDSNNSQTKLLTVWLLSDVLFRDARLRPSSDINLFAKLLGGKLGVTLTPRHTKELLSVMARRRRTGSWSVKWGLPRPTLAGLMAGSCFVFEVVGSVAVCDKKLRDIEESGFGERCAEGFGQMLFNSDILSQNNLTQKQWKPKDQNDPSPEVRGDQNPEAPASPLSQEAAEALETFKPVIELEAWRKAIRYKVLECASKQDWIKTNIGITQDKPKASQLGALRQVIGRVNKVNHEVFTGWWGHLQDNHNRKDKWLTEAFITYEKTIDESGCEQKIAKPGKVGAIVQEADTIWNLLYPKPSIHPDDDEPPILTDETEVKTALWAEAVHALFDACIRSIKREGEKAVTEGTVQNG